MIESHNLVPGTPVEASFRRGGLFRRAVRAGESGEVLYARDDGKVVVEWDNGRTTAVHPTNLATETCDGLSNALSSILDVIVPGGSLEAQAETEPEDSPRNMYLRGFADCHATVRRALEEDGFIRVSPK